MVQNAILPCIIHTCEHWQATWQIVRKRRTNQCMTYLTICKCKKLGEIAGSLSSFDSSRRHLSKHSMKSGRSLMAWTESPKIFALADDLFSRIHKQYGMTKCSDDFGHFVRCSLPNQNIFEDNPGRFTVRILRALLSKPSYHITLADGLNSTGTGCCMIMMSRWKDHCTSILMMFMLNGWIWIGSLLIYMRLSISNRPKQHGQVEVDWRQTRTAAASIRSRRHNCEAYSLPGNLSETPHKCGSPPLYHHFPSRGHSVLNIASIYSGGLCASEPSAS